MKKLYEGNLFWTTTANPTANFPEIHQDMEARVLIIGGGISGNLCAYELASRGISVIICEQGKLGEGSSAANTGMLQYCSDDMLCDLIESIGEEKAVLFYKMCQDGMKALKALNRKLKKDTGFIPRRSVYLASLKKDVPKLKKEYQALKKNQFPVKYLTAKALLKKYGVEKPAALETSGDAEVNPYKFLQSLIAKNLELGVQFFENTAVNVDFSPEKGKEVASTEQGFKIRAEFIVLATGYTTLYPELKSKMEINRTYALTSTVSKTPLWKDRVMFWETRRPYLYFRATEDNRVIAGGLDKKVTTLENDMMEVKKNNAKILKKIKKLIQGLDVQLEYNWDALFGISKDGLPFIGTSQKDPRRFYLLGFGGNGIAYSMAGALIIADAIEGKENPYAAVVSPDRF